MTLKDGSRNVMVFTVRSGTLYLRTTSILAALLLVQQLYYNSINLAVRMLYEYDLYRPVPADRVVPGTTLLLELQLTPKNRTVESIQQLW